MNRDHKDDSNLFFRICLSGVLIAIAYYGSRWVLDEKQSYVPMPPAIVSQEVVDKVLPPEVDAGMASPAIDFDAGIAAEPFDFDDNFATETYEVDAGIAAEPAQPTKTSDMLAYEFFSDLSERITSKDYVGAVELVQQRYEKDIPAGERITMNRDPASRIIDSFGLVDLILDDDFKIDFRCRCVDFDYSQSERLLSLISTINVRPDTNPSKGLLEITFNEAINYWENNNRRPSHDRLDGYVRTLKAGKPYHTAFTMFLE